MEIAVSIRGWHDDAIGRMNGMRSGKTVVGAVGVVINRDGRDDGFENIGGLPSSINFTFVLPGFVARSEFHRSIIAWIGKFGIMLRLICYIEKMTFS